MSMNFQSSVFVQEVAYSSFDINWIIELIAFIINPWGA